MTYKEYIEYLDCELYYDCGGGKPNWLKRIRIKHFQPNTNCMYLARTMWFLNSKGKIGKILSKLLYLRIYHRYGCCIYPNAEVGKGFIITHPVGIVLGKCHIGENFVCFQNTTVGVRHENGEVKGLIPTIGNDVWLCSNAMVLGNITVCVGCRIGAGAIVLNDLTEPGTYVG